MFFFVFAYSVFLASKPSKEPKQAMNTSKHLLNTTFLLSVKLFEFEPPVLTAKGLPKHLVATQTSLGREAVPGRVRSCVAQLLLLQ